MLYHYNGVSEQYIQIRDQLVYSTQYIINDVIQKQKDEQSNNYTGQQQVTGTNEHNNDMTVVSNPLCHCSCHNTVNQTRINTNDNNNNSITATNTAINTPTSIQSLDLSYNTNNNIIYNTIMKQLQLLEMNDNSHNTAIQQHIDTDNTLSELYNIDNTNVSYVQHNNDSVFDLS